MVRSLTVNQEKLLGIVRAESGKRARQTLERLNLSEVGMRRFRAAKDKIEQAPLVHGIQLRDRYRDELVIDSLLDIGRVLNLFEIGDFPGGVHDYRFRGRLLNEFKIYGATRQTQMIMGQMQDSERPSYAALDYWGEHGSIASLQFFGPYRFVLKPGLKGHSTFTPSDSFQVERDQVYVWETIEGVLATRLNARYWYEYVLDGGEPFITEEGVHYIEAQILGGFDVADVTRLYYPAADRVDHEFFAKLRRLELDHGIELVYY